MRTLVTGAAGMLGQDVVDVFRSAGHEVTAVGREVDITDSGAVTRAVAGQDVVVSCAAWTAVDAAESAEAQAFEVNATGAANVARAAAAAGARLVHISTDYVFDGTATSPYAEDAPMAPRSAYGRTKAAGEWAVRSYCPESYVVRTAWLYGPGGKSFVGTMLRLAGSHDTLTVIDDQRGAPTATPDLARFLAELVAAEAPFGTYHGTSQGETTWCGFAREIFRLSGLDPQRVHGISTEDYPLPAPRPAYSVLGHDRTRAADVAVMPDWQQSLARVLPTIPKPA